MKVKEINLFRNNVVFVMAYGDDEANFCTEEFEKGSEWYERIISEYGETEIKKLEVSTAYHLTVVILIEKEICFKISREVMNRYMGEDNSWEEIA